MRYSEFVQLNEMIVPMEMLAPRYFHGSKKQYVKGILAHGLQPPDFVAFGTKNTALRPVAGRVYMSPNAKAAAKYGKYLFVIYRESLGDLQPDEDEVGSIYSWIMQKDFSDLDKTRQVHAGSHDFIARMELLNQPEQQRGLSNFKYYMNYALTPNMKRQIVGGEYAWWAKGGKRALKNMPPDIMRWLIALGVHVSHEGPVMPDEAWKITGPGLLPDGSNLAQIAGRLDYDKTNLTPPPPPRPPQKFNVTFRWITNYPFFGGVYGPRPEVLPEPKYKTKVVPFMAPSEEVARGEAELYMERTVPSAEYTIINLTKTV